MVLEELSHHTKGSGMPFAPTPALTPVCLYNHVLPSIRSPEISIIMPAFNEEKEVGPLIDRTQRILQQITKYYEIIVIDDGSNDHTLPICRERNVTVIHNRHNWGKGYALREGFKYARGTIIVTMDSDGDHHPEEIPLLLQPFIAGKIEAVLGTRFVHNKNSPVTTAINTFGNRLFNFLIHRLTHHHFTDTQCGFRAFKRNCLSTLHLKSHGYDIETEMIVQLARQRIPYCEIPVSSPVNYFRKSNINRLKDGLQILFTIFKTRIINFPKKREN